jgi:two-component system, NtrC family, response regulator AtoC
MRILLVDDHPDVRHSLAAFIEQLGHHSLQTDNGPDAVAMARREVPDLILSDLRMPGMDGLHLLSALEHLDHPPPLALMTAFGDADTAIRALRQGAIDYLRKPIDVRELHRLIERIQTTHQATPSTPGATTIREEADGLIRFGQVFDQVITLCDRLHQATDLPCLIEGETGSGKELIARRIHHGGTPKTNRPFIALNCAAIATGLFEAELFGYAPGAFTGAVSGGSQGKLALAAGGTVLLDEVADLPLDQQAKLLRVLEDRSWYAVGSSTLQRLTARIIGACNTDLLDRVRHGQFREDLYYRLKVGHVHVPPLRERSEDIVPMAQIFMARIRKLRGRGFQKLSSAAAAKLTALPWPGNVRQLHHFLEQAGMVNDGAVLDAPIIDHFIPAPLKQSPTSLKSDTPSIKVTASAVIPIATLPNQPTALQLPDKLFDLDIWQRAIISAALEKHDNAPVRTAAYLGISRKVLYTLRKRYGLLDPETVDET